MTIIATWGGSASNSYVSHTDATSFITTAIVYQTPWTNATTPIQEAALQEASRDIDALQYVGERYHHDQLLEWPRSGFQRWPHSLGTYSNELQSVEQRRMMEAVRRACCHQAVFLLQSNGRNRHAEAQASGIAEWSESNGPALSESVRYRDGATSVLAISVDAKKLLSPWIQGRRVYRS